MGNYPIPTHLIHILKADTKHSDMHNINGEIVCTCGCEQFQIMQNEDAEYDSTIPYGEQEGIKINAICEKCGKTLLLFDQATQGYDGFVCHDFKTAKDESLTRLTCRKCGQDVFQVRMCIEVEDQEQFIEECVMEYPDEFSEDNYVDAFNWITVTLHCVNCDDKNEWINLELS